jgi:hypothetical protein
MTEAEIRAAAAKLGLVVVPAKDEGPRRPRGAGRINQAIPGVRNKGPRRQTTRSGSLSVRWRLGEEGLGLPPERAKRVRRVV